MNALTALIQLAILLSLILVLGGPVALLVLVFRCLITRRYSRALLVVAAFVAGALGGGILTWSLVPASWTLPFWTTLSAAGDARTYGHPVEHEAESIITVVTFACVGMGTLSAAAAAGGARLATRFKLR